MRIGVIERRMAHIDIVKERLTAQIDIVKERQTITRLAIDTYGEK